MKKWKQNCIATDHFKTKFKAVHNLTNNKTKFYQYLDVYIEKILQTSQLNKSLSKVPESPVVNS